MQEKKENIHFTYAVDLTIGLDEEQIVSKCKSNKVQLTKPYIYRKSPKTKKKFKIQTDYCRLRTGRHACRTDFGRSRLKADYSWSAEKILMHAKKDVNEFWTKRRLLTKNLMFSSGEGGAGTFQTESTTGIKSPFIRKVLDELYEAGAPEEILLFIKASYRNRQTCSCSQKYP